MIKRKVYATLGVLLSMAAVATFHTPTRAEPEKFRFLYQGPSEEQGVEIVESIRPTQLGLVRETGTEPLSTDAAMRCSLETVKHSVLLLNNRKEVTDPATYTSIFLRCEEGIFRVKGFRFR